MPLWMRLSILVLPLVLVQVSGAGFLYCELDEACDPATDPDCELDGGTSDTASHSHSDPRGDHIDSESTRTPTYTEDDNDLVKVATETTTVDSADPTTVPFGDCGATDSAGLTVCSASSQEMPDGEVYVFDMELATDVPLASSTHCYTYAIVVQSDSDTSNDWVFNPPYDFDLYRDTDRWYQLMWDMNYQQWTVFTQQVDSSQYVSGMPTNARAVINGPHIRWYIGAAELNNTPPPYRATAFGHDCYYSVSDRGADVSGADPTEPLYDF